VLGLCLIMRLTKSLPELPEGFVYRLDLQHHVTPRLLRDQPIHRWFWFPHSFSPQLIDEILRAYPLPPGGCILDPFVGAGTTVLRARELGYGAVGVDWSPLAVFVSRVKLTAVRKDKLWDPLRFVLEYTPLRELPPLPARLERAFSRYELAHLLALHRRIDVLPPPVSDFFRLALLRVQGRISRAIPDGGWFRWVAKEDQSQRIAAWFEEQARLQMEDLEFAEQGYEKSAGARILRDDARRLEQIAGRFDLVITSPPYPNRHDYSRIYHAELLALGTGEEEIMELRKGALRSHVEARPPSIPPVGYQMPAILQEILSRFPTKIDSRIRRMLQGYFEDIYLVLRALKGRLRGGALCALVVGNVRYHGIMIPVDEIIIRIGEQAGYRFEGAWVARLRGNSAQQMGRFGREPARESIVFLRTIDDPMLEEDHQNGVE